MYIKASVSSFFLHRGAIRHLYQQTKKAADTLRRLRLIGIFNISLFQQFRQLFGQLLPRKTGAKIPSEIINIVVMGTIPVLHL
ncbi:hypothetical protein ACQKLP_08695 [Chitinophaga sp. NPDC101104]|uniref:hypothetical protein n=1 Tax=Chitinophaga sp. NPDC101104 TaxID=3390561 RepID=UPI003CFE86F9